MLSSDVFSAVATSLSVYFLMASVVVFPTEKQTTFFFNVFTEKKLSAALGLKNATPSKSSIIFWGTSSVLYTTTSSTLNPLDNKRAGRSSIRLLPQKNMMFLSSLFSAITSASNKAFFAVPLMEFSAKYFLTAFLVAPSMQNIFQFAFGNSVVPIADK